MKFNDGFWLLKHGIKAFYGLQVIKKEEVDGDLHLQVATRRIRHRGDTLGGPLLNVTLHSPIEGIVGVKVEHFKNLNDSPAIPLFPSAEPTLFKPTIRHTDTTSKLSSGSLSAIVSKDPYTIEFRVDDRLLTQVGPKHQAIIEVPFKWTQNSAPNASCLANDPDSNPLTTVHPEIIKYINCELSISPGELFYGFGEQFGPYVKNGQTIAIWNQDGGTSSDQAYKCVPFFMSNRGYGVFINHFGSIDVEVGSEKVSRVGFSVPNRSLEFFIIHGTNPLEVLSRYTLLTGRPALPPAWTFGLWLSTSFLTDYSNQTVSKFLQGMKDYACPVRVFHLDCFWMAQYEWCSFTFDPENFPDPKGYIKNIKATFGVKICVWINPYFSQHSPLFEEGARAGFFIRRTDGSIWQWDLWQPGLAILDITNKDACTWYADKLTTLLDLGVDAFKTDFGERIPHCGIAYHDGSDPYRMHNAYSVLYNELVFGLLEKRFGIHEAVVFARSSAAGGQRFPVHWGGDCESSFEAMAETIRGCLSLTTSGFGFTSHDIGGFEGHPPPEIYMRWLAFGLFSSHSRLHGSSSYRVPWEYGEEACKTLSKLLNMKHRLMPYLYNQAIRAHRFGHPVQRAIWIEYLSDRSTHHLDQQYMLGSSLLVAPVFVPLGHKSEYYLPEGIWTCLWDFTVKRVGPVWVKEEVAIDDIPVWIRPGSLLILGPDNIGRPDYDLASSLDVVVSEIGIGEAVQTDVPTGNGIEVAGQISVVRSETEITIQLGGTVAVRSLVIAIKGFRGTLEGSVVDSANGVLFVTPRAGLKTIRLEAIGDV